MEKQDQHQRQVLLSLMLIQEKAKSLYEDLKKKHGEKSEGTSFKANHAFIDSRLERSFTM